MAVKGKSQEVKSSYLAGVAEVRVLEFNPTLKDYERIYGPKEGSEEEAKEPEYVKTKDGEDLLLATFIVEEVISGKKQKLVFPIANKVEYKEASGNTLFVNDQALSSYVDSKANLKEYFTEVKRWDSSSKSMKFFRESKVREGFSGEKAFLEFLNNWLNLDFSADAETEIWLDMKRMFNGDFREMKEVVKAFPAQTVITAWHVNTKEEEDGSLKYYQNVYRGAFSNSKTRKSNLMAIFNSLQAKGVDWKDWANQEANKKDFALRNFRRFMEQLTGEYGPDGFVMQALGDFDPTADITSSPSTKHTNPSFSSDASY